MQVEVNSKNITVINDSYNANPESMKAAIRTLKQAGADKKTFIIVGEMLELGSDSKQMHEEVADLIQKLDVKKTLVVGNGAKIVLSEFKCDPINMIKHLRFNLSLLNSELQKAKIFESYLKSNYNSNQFVFYSYWFDTWSIILSIIKFKSPHLINSYYSRAHGFDIYKDQTKNGYHPFKNFMLKQVSKVFTISKNGQNYLRKNYKLYQNKIQHSYLGSTFNKFTDKINKPQLVILTCAKVRSIKRIELIPDILKELPNTFNVKWILIGDGEGIYEIKDKCIHLNNNIECVFTGNLSKEKVIEFYNNNRIDLFLSVSRSEGLPYTMIEAISFGIPLLSTDVGGCSEICNDNTGILIEKDFDVKDVANKIVSFAKSEKNTNLFRAGVRRYWEENFNAEKNYINFYEEIVNDEK